MSLSPVIYFLSDLRLQISYASPASLFIQDLRLHFVYRISGFAQLTRVRRHALYITAVQFSNSLRAYLVMSKLSATMTRTGNINTPPAQDCALPYGDSPKETRWANTINTGGYSCSRGVLSCSSTFVCYRSGGNGPIRSKETIHRSSFRGGIIPCSAKTVPPYVTRSTYE